MRKKKENKEAVPRRAIKIWSRKLTTNNKGVKKKRRDKNPPVDPLLLGNLEKPCFFQFGPLQTGL